MTNQEMAVILAQRVREAGGTAYFVGGLVRDLILKKENKDFDIEVHGLTPAQLEAVLSSLGRVKKFGESFGVFGLEHYDLDIAMPRKETATGRGHRDFEVSVDPFIGEENAAKRRDFTINAMMQNILTGEILDFFHGREDMENRILRHVNDRSFAEDPLRVLRGAQFASRFGFAVAPATRAFCQGMDLSALASERIMIELEKALLKGQKPSLFFEELRCMNQLSYWFPEVEKLRGIEQNPEYHPEGNVWNHTMEVLDRAAQLRGKAKYPLGLMVSALCHDFGKITATAVVKGKIHAIGHEEQGLPIAEAFLGRITNEDKLLRYVRNMILLHMRPTRLAATSHHRKKFMKMFDDSLCPEDLLLLSEADRGNRIPSDGMAGEILEEELAQYHSLLETPPVTGAELLAEGYRPGKHIGLMLAYARELWLAGISKEKALELTMREYPKEK